MDSRILVPMHGGLLGLCRFTTKYLPYALVLCKPCWTIKGWGAWTKLTEGIDQAVEHAYLLNIVTTSTSIITFSGPHMFPLAWKSGSFLSQICYMLDRWSKNQCRFNFLLMTSLEANIFNTTAQKGSCHLNQFHLILLHLPTTLNIQPSSKGGKPVERVTDWYQLKYPPYFPCTRGLFVCLFVGYSMWSTSQMAQLSSPTSSCPSAYQLRASQTKQHSWRRGLSSCLHCKIQLWVALYQCLQQCGWIS